MEHGIVTSRAECKVTSLLASGVLLLTVSPRHLQGHGSSFPNGGDTSLSERSISPMVMVTNQWNAALHEKQDSKWHKIFSIKFSFVWSTTEMYGKLIHGITLSVVRIFHKCGNLRIPQIHVKGLFFLLKTFNSQACI